MNAAAVLDMLIISLSIYWLLLLVRGTTAMTVLRGVALLLIATFLLSRVLELQVLGWILRHSVAGIVIAIAIVFQREIRRAHRTRGPHRPALGAGAGGPALHERTRDPSRDAAGAAAHGRADRAGTRDRATGGDRYGHHAAGGEISVKLLESIFAPNSPLHDGAVIVRGATVVAAGCTLPLSESPLPSEYGMRHRAGLGVIESTDAVVIVVSEEHGEVSLASNGRMMPELDEARLRRQLDRLLDLESEQPALAERETAAGADGEHRAS
ncbi:MAG: TIGR00159 family protein [Dehalococcoidia bacterium]|nr:TIGR00159 family protein [Dehalococcoidia bacterium]